jgi:DNA-binding phage protein
MKFTFEEAELINNFFDERENLTKEQVITELQEAEIHTEDPQLIEIAVHTIHKIKELDDPTFEKIFSDLPIDTNSNY